jgi:alpha-L-rhamnosidase
LTVHKAGRFWYGLGFGSTLSLTNSLLISVTNLGEPFDGAYNITNSSDAGVFQSAGFGSHYLPTNSPYLGTGTTNLSAGLLDALRARTVVAPVVYSNVAISNTITLGPQAQRDVGPPISPGYHYFPLDYLFGGVDANANVTFSPGTVAGWFRTSQGWYHAGHGIHIADGKVVTFDGIAERPCYWVRRAVVQEGNATLWEGGYGPGGITGWTWPDFSQAPQVNARFTRFSLLANDAVHIRDDSGYLVVHARDCEFWGGSLGGYASSLNYTNCLMERVTLWTSWDGIPTTNCNLALQNCLMRGGAFNPGRRGPDGYGNYPLWFVHDTAFDATAFHYSDAAGAAAAFTDFDYDAYLDGGNTNAASGTHDLTVPTFNWQTNWFGNYYLPTNSALVDAGDVGAATVGLYHFTTQTNDVKEGSSTVDISYHHVAADSTGAPVDTDGGGCPDYLEDRDGDGTVDAGESDWRAGHGSDDWSVILAPEYLRCEYRQNPLGVDTNYGPPRLYWIVKSGHRAQMQLAFEIGAATTEDHLNGNNFDLWDSGKVYSDETIHVEFGRPDLLASGMRVYWKVRTWDSYYGLASAWSTNAFFQMGLLNASDWNGVNWIGAIGYTPANPCPMYRSQPLVLTNPIAHATAYVSAKGVYELWINGQRIGQNVLGPEWTDYNKRIQYQSFDVTSNLVSGTATSTNVVGGIVGEGWFSGSNEIGNGFYGNPLPQLALRLAIENADRTSTDLVTDGTWTCFTKGPIRHASIWQGEGYDATREGAKADWSTAAYASAATYFTAGITNTNVVASQMATQPDDPLQVNRSVAPVAMRVLSSGPYEVVRIYDMGQNMVGWSTLWLTNTTQTPGLPVTLQYAELLQLDANHFPNPNGDIDTTSLVGAAYPNHAAQTDTNAVSGDPTSGLEPHFTYHGFRYVRVSAPPSVALGINSLVGSVIRNKSAVTGGFACSDSHLNRLMTNILWTQEGNFFGVSTDCPQRVERFGYLGDAQTFSQTACFNMDMAAFYTKFIRDIRDDQGSDGHYPFYAPYMNRFTDWQDIGWEAAGVVLPWRLYENYGDARILEEHYTSATNFARYLTNNAANFPDVPNDWLNADSIYGWPYAWQVAPPNNAAVELNGYRQGFYAYSVDMLANMSRVLQQQADMKRDAGGATFYGNQYTYYTNLASQIRSNFFAATNTFGIRTDASGYVTNIGGGVQADFALALFFNMIPETQRVSCVDCLLTNAHRCIEHYNEAYTATTDNLNHLSGGIQSCGRTLLELTHGGHTEKAYQLVADRRFPAWIYSVTNGTAGVFQETTVSERWNSYISGPGSDHGYLYSFGGNSFNHYAFGSVGEWIWRVVAGINPDAANPAYKNTIIMPQIGGGVTNASGSFESIRGLVGCAWITNNTTNTYTVVVPANTTASFFVPATNLPHITESGVPATNAPGVLVLPITNNFTVFQLGSGVYNFTNWP